MVLPSPQEGAGVLSIFLLHRLGPSIYWLQKKNQAYQIYKENV